MQIKRTIRSPRHRFRLLVALLVVGGTVATGLVAGTASGSGKDKVTLRVSLFGDFGYHDLYAQYEAAHPNIDIKEDIQSYADHHSNLAKNLAVGSGADDIEAIEVGFIGQFKSQPNLFVDLNKYGAKKLQKRWLAWKWSQSLARNGAQIGLGTDVGSLGICYRRDLFRKAGLPSGRAAVSKLWPTWQKYMAVGKRFEGPRAAGRLVLRRRQQRLQRDDRPAESGVLLAERQGHRRLQPGGQEGLGPDDAGHQGPRERRPGRVQQRLEHGLQERHVRHRDVPGLDDGLHPGPGPENRGQVGHRRGSGRRRQLGRLVPERPEAGLPPGRGRRPGQVPDLAGRRRSTSSSRPATCPASPRC